MLKLLKQYNKNIQMKYSFLWAIYREKPLSAFLYGLLYSFLPLLDLITYLNYKFRWLTEIPTTDSISFRMINSPSFWLMMLFNLMPLFCLFLIKQQKLIVVLAVWIFCGFSFYLVNNYTVANYPISTLILVSSSLALIRSRNKKLILTYINLTP